MQPLERCCYRRDKTMSIRFGFNNPKIFQNIPFWSCKIHSLSINWPCSRWRDVDTDETRQCLSGLDLITLKIFQNIPFWSFSVSEHTETSLKKACIFSLLQPTLAAFMTGILGETFDMSSSASVISTSKPGLQLIEYSLLVFWIVIRFNDVWLLMTSDFSLCIHEAKVGNVLVTHAGLTAVLQNFQLYLWYYQHRAASPCHWNVPGPSENTRAIWVQHLLSLGHLCANHGCANSH